MRVLACLLFFASALPLAAFPVARCINLGAALEAPREGDWGYTIQEPHLTLIAEAGFDTVRLPVRFDLYWHEEQLDPALMARVDQVIGWAEAAGLQVILDLHHFEAMNSDPAANASQLIKIWAALGRHYAGHGDGLMFELFNEPNGAFTTALAAEIYAELRRILRRDHPERWIIAGGGNWNDLSEMEHLSAPDHPRDVRTFHFYDPWPFTHQQAPYLDDPPPARGWGSLSDHAALEAAMDQAAAAEGPVFLGEFGVYGATAPGPRLAWIRAVREAAEARALPWCYWGFSQGEGVGFSAFNTGTNAWDPGILDALFE